LAIKATSFFVQGIGMIMKAMAEADDPNAVAEKFEKEGLFKLVQETGENLNAAMQGYMSRMEATPQLHRNRSSNNTQF
jgi:hypothetical protein